MLDYRKTINQLPNDAIDSVEIIADKTINSQIPLRICLVGEFSTGKSSLINALIGENFLPSAREETTALPTFIEYASVLNFELVNVDGLKTSINQQQFSDFTVHAPENALCSVLSHPSDWLKGLSLIDLPGLGSQSQQHGDYTIAQISASDVIIYLLSPRGATQGDLKMLRVIKDYGKHIKIVVSQWDTIEQSIAEGEQAPDLIEWQEQIAQKTGINQSLIGVSKYGFGCDKIIAFLQDTKQNVSAIRESRFKAELVPFLTHEFEKIKQQQEICSVISAEQTQKLFEKLLKEKETLIQLKSELYERSNEDQNQIEQKAQQKIDVQRKSLEQNLQMIPLKRQEDWEIFTEKSQTLLQQTVTVTANNLIEISTDYGQLNLSEAQVKRLNVHLPMPESIAVEDFIDNSRLSLLNNALEKQQYLATLEQEKLNTSQDIDTESIEKNLQAIRFERDSVLKQELPKVTQVIEGDNSGSMIGKNIGQLLDIGLILVDGPLAIMKMASMVGEGSKVLSVVNETSKVAKTIVKHPDAIPIVNQLGFLEKLSLSYWGEQLGKKYDRPAQTIEVIDPQAEQERRQLLAEHDKQIALQRAELQRLENLKQEREFTGWALEQSLKEQQLLKNKIQALQEKAQSAKLEAEREQVERQKKLLSQCHQELINQSLIHFDQQTRPMIDLLRATCKRYWQNYIEKMLTENLQTIDALNIQLKQAPEQKEAELITLQDKSKTFETVLNSIRA